MDTKIKEECFTCGTETSDPIYVGHKAFCSSGCQNYERLDEEIYNINDEIVDLENRLECKRNFLKQKYIEQSSYKKGSNE
jgi:endogenous inhibitor of DNA gyrase (YacG/DUF329 family)